MESGIPTAYHLSGTICFLDDIHLTFVIAVLAIATEVGCQVSKAAHSTCVVMSWAGGLRCYEVPSLLDTDSGSTRAGHRYNIILHQTVDTGVIYWKIQVLINKGTM